MGLASKLAAVSERPLRVMTFNIHHGEGTDGRLELARTAALISLWRPDVAGLQEVDRRFAARSALADQASWLGRSLRMSAWYGPAMSVRDSGGMREYGNALLTRDRLSARDWAPLPHAAGSEARSVVRGRHPLGVDIWATHFSHRDHGERVDQARAIIEAWQRNARPTVLLLDANAAPDDRPIDILGEAFIDVWGSLRPEPGWTFSTSNPNRRIDYVFCTQEIRPVQVELADAGVTSDHHAVVADLLVPPGERSGKGTRRETAGSP